jgi:hypothetical protein
VNALKGNTLFYSLSIFILCRQVSSCLGELSDLNGQYEAVSQKTTELHVACQDLLKVKYITLKAIQNLCVFKSSDKGLFGNCAQVPVSGTCLRFRQVNRHKSSKKLNLSL